MVFLNLPREKQHVLSFYLKTSQFNKDNGVVTKPKGLKKLTRLIRSLTSSCERFILGKFIDYKFYLSASCSNLRYLL